jgi:ferredoxin-NADP reductase
VNDVQTLAISESTRHLTQRLSVTGTRQVADAVLLVEFAHPTGESLPPWEPGAHLELVLASGLIRHYSLCGDPADRSKYVVAVLRVPDGGGGSREIHDTDLIGTQLEVRGPRNHFALLDAPGYLFLAGGIGITPISAMVRSVALGDRPWKLIYGGRSQTSMAFADELLSLDPSRVELVPEDLSGFPDLPHALDAAPDGTAVYCCGPSAMLRAVEELYTAHQDRLTLRFERFAGDGADPSSSQDATAFQVELRRSGVTLEVPHDRSLLDVVRDVVKTQQFSCTEGYCGTCETDVLEGTPEHNDDVLSDEERATNKTMMICVGRSKSPLLVLDV